MAGVLTNSAEVILLNYITNLDAPEELDVRLFTNNYTPIESTVVGDLTEATGSGYAAYEIDSSDWTITSGDPSTAVHGTITFTFSGALGNVYGFYITRRVTGDLFFVERFSNGPYNVAGSGFEVKVGITLQLS